MLILLQLLFRRIITCVTQEALTGWAGSPYAISGLSVCLSVCPSCLSVTLVYCGQTIIWIKMKLGMQVGLGTGHIVLGGDAAPLP